MHEATKIGSVHMLRAVLFEDDSRAQTIFQLRENFPLWCGCPYKFDKAPERDIPLDEHSRAILAWSEFEATRMGDYWIDTEHLLLGILGDRASWAATYLRMTGLTLDAVRETIQANRHSRPDYGPIPRFWRFQTRLLRWF